MERDDRNRPLGSSRSGHKVFLCSQISFPSTQLLPMCYLNLFQNMVSVWTAALRLQVCKHEDFFLVSVPRAETPVHSGIQAVLLGQFLCQFYPTSCQKHSMTALAENYEDDWQYSSLAFLCMRENVLPFSQQLLQIAIAPESPTEVLVRFFSHAVSHQDGTLLVELFCVSHAIQCLLLRPPLSFVYDTTLLSSTALVCFFISATEFSLFLVLSLSLPG